MDLFKAQTLANELMKQHNLIASGWWFSFDNAKRRFGVCNFGLKKIGLSSHLVKLNEPCAQYHTTRDSPRLSR